MSRKKKLEGKIGYCDNLTLGITDKHNNPISGGHYVYICEINGNKCNVNVITSLEDKTGRYEFHKIKKIKRGYLYPIPKNDATLPLWSAINLDGNIKNVKITDIKSIGKIKMKRKHRFFVGKFTKK